LGGRLRREIGAVLITSLCERGWCGQEQAAENQQDDRNDPACQRNPPRISVMDSATLIERPNSVNHLERSTLMIAILVAVGTFWALHDKRRERRGR
jgi:hypothetical protein